MSNSPNPKTNQNEISSGLFKGSDLGDRIEETVADFSASSGFVPGKLLGKSSWWGSSEIGAFHYSGTYKGKNVVLKIQGVKPQVSEIFMIQSFAKNNQSKIIRPPELYYNQPWDDQKRYEALVMEDIGGKRIVNTPTNKEEVATFFSLYTEYRKNCIQRPWLTKPVETISDTIASRFTKWREASFKIYPNHPYRKDDDISLVDESVKKLVEGYREIEPEFGHGHFSEGDLYTAGEQVVLLSNLYWSWRPPFYDTVFAYHWYIYHLASVTNITLEQIETQRDIWLQQINNFSKKFNPSQKKLLKLALLERAAAGLNLDALSCDTKVTISKYLVDKTRELLKQYLREIN